ncbi:carboxypeptidase-like regulatory domain-containing protein [Hyalangium sp.]|uniref:carboxypeptidase-like regulatory domain-containing protein n=1 Tax=Hyalangium sp. TaxID=2028555 RepID=UPI002D4C4BD8|nr:carboxypeptidase-like regulatory domain-containing protein [Hyalangium sp.]HYI02337.1 carboxypeptidase-like regulatory domain-containing protein [Hyalangium sp.]
MDPPSAEAAAFCQVLPGFVLGRVGMRVRFDVKARDAAGEPLVPVDGITWTATAEAVTGGGSGTQATFTLTAPTETTAVVEALVGSTACQAQVTVLPAGVPPGQVRVLVTDELTGRPLPRALVVASDALGNTTATSETDSHGAAWVPATGEVGLSVFHEDYGYLTLAHYDTERGTRDVLLPVRRNPLDLYGGARGTFSNVPASKNVLVGVSGLSAPAMGFNLAERQFVGPSVPVSVDILGKPLTLNLPSNSYVSLSSEVLRPEYATPGVAGICDTELAGNPIPEDAIRAGVCGTRTSWAITGELPLSELNFNGIDPRHNFLFVLFQNTNVLRRFHSSVVRDVQFRLKPFSDLKPEQRNYEDTAHYTPVNHGFQQLPLGFQFPVIVPTPPPYSKIPLDRINIMGVADEAERGATLLGGGSAVVPDALKTTTLVRVYMAPTHHGLEGSPYRLLVIASSTKDQEPYIEDTASSILIVPLAKLPTDPRTSPPVKITSTFLPVPGDGRFNFNSFPYEGLQGREFRFLTDPGLDDATLVNVLFKSNDYRNWVVLMDPKHAMTGIRLPLPPSHLWDRTHMVQLYSEEATSRARLHVQALSTRKADNSKLDLRTLAEAEDANLALLSDFTTAISEHDHGRPKVKWVVPERDPNIVPRVDHTTLLIVSVSDFHINRDPADDGHVLLTFEGGTGCAAHKLRRDVPANQSQGEARFLIPSGCRGNGVRMTATLVDSNNVPLSPPISGTVIVNII